MGGGDPAGFAGRGGGEAPVGSRVRRDRAPTCGTMDANPAGAPASAGGLVPGGTTAMMPTQLTSWLLFQNAATHFGEVEIVSKEASGTHRYTYLEFSRRAQQLMHA